MKSNIKTNIKSNIKTNIKSNIKILDIYKNVTPAYIFG